WIVRAAGFDAAGIVRDAVADDPCASTPDVATSRLSPDGSTGSESSTASLSVSAIAFPVTVATPTVSAVKRQSTRCSPADGIAIRSTAPAAAPFGPDFGVRFAADRLTATVLLSGK